MATDSPSIETPPSAPIRFSLRSALIGIAIVAIVLACYLKLAKWGRIRSDSLSLSQDMTMIRNGLTLWHDARGQWPPATKTDNAGQPLNSWRFQILPFLEYDWDPSQLSLDVAWNKPPNAALSESDYASVYNIRWNTETAVYGVVGPGTVFDEAAPPPDKLPADVILVMEVADSKTHWMQPGDYEVTKLLANSGRLGDHLHGLFPDRFHVMFADGEVWALSPDAPMTALHPFLTIAGAKTHDRDDLLASHKVN